MLRYLQLCAGIHNKSQLYKTMINNKSGKKNMNIIKLNLMLFSPLLLTACATNALFGNSETEITTKTKIALQDQIIAIGRTSQPIQGYENALVLAGQTHSFFVQPNIDSNNSADLFQKIFSHIDLKSLYLAPALDNDAMTQINTQQHNSILLKVDEKLKNNRSVPYITSLYFIKKTQLLTAKETSTLKDLGFKYQTELTDYPKQTFCIRTIHTQITLASKVQNLNQLQYKLKQPIDIQYQVTTTSRNYSRQAFKIFTPLTVAFDIVTSPIQGGIFILASMLGAPGSL